MPTVFRRIGGRVIPIRTNQYGQEIPSKDRPPAQMIYAQKDINHKMNESWSNTYKNKNFKKWNTAYEGMRENVMTDVFNKKSVNNLKGFKRSK